MQINIITVGTSKEKYWNDAKDEYLKRLSKFHTVKEYVVKDEANNQTEELVLKKEAERIQGILDKIKRTYLICLAIEGKQYDSVAFSKLIEKIAIEGNSSITFIIGGSCGIDESIKKQANLKLSFGLMTYPHQMFKIIFLEQLYRTAKISNNESYHK